MPTVRTYASWLSLSLHLNWWSCYQCAKLINKATTNLRLAFTKLIASFARHITIHSFYWNFYNNKKQQYASYERLALRYGSFVSIWLRKSISLLQKKLTIVINFWFYLFKINLNEENKWKQKTTIYKIYYFFNLSISRLYNSFQTFNFVRLRLNLHLSPLTEQIFFSS